MKIIIAGGREYKDYPRMVEEVCHILLKVEDMNHEIISGCANGADKLGEQFAEDLRFPVKKFPANWNKHGKAAGPIRNREMAEYGEMLIAFWDGKSRGTKNMIDEAEKYNLIVHVIKY